MIDGLARRDNDRAAVYAAEDQWTAVLDRGGRVDFFGSVLDVSVQRRFGDLATIQRYVDDLSGRIGAAQVLVRERRGRTRAHYADGVIAIPVHAGWAGRHSVVLHEFAHHVAGAECGHGVEFRMRMLDLVEHELGAPAALLLRAGYEAQGLQVAGHVA